MTTVCASTRSRCIWFIIFSTRAGGSCLDVEPIVLPSCIICSMSDKLICNRSIRPRRYSMPCFLKHHLNLCRIVGDTDPSGCLVCTLLSIALMSPKTALLSSSTCSVVLIASGECTGSADSSTAAVCFSKREYNVTLFDIALISYGAFAISQPIAFRINDSLKPAPATPITDATISV